MGGKSRFGRWGLIVVGATVIAVLVGCSTTGAKAPAAGGTSSNGQQGVTVSDGPAVVASIDPAQASDQAPGEGVTVAQLGQSINYPDGLSISVGPPTRRAASKNVAAPPEFRGTQVLLLTVTLTNKGTTPITLNQYISGPEVTYGGQVAPHVYDTGYMVAPQTTVLSGKAFTYRALYGVGAAPGDLQVEWKRDFTTQPAIFTGQG